MRANYLNLAQKSPLTSEVIRCAQVPLEVPISAIIAEVEALPSYWMAHLNTAHYTGDWTVLSLRAPGGNADFIAGGSMGEAPYADTPFMEQTPRIRELMHSLPFTPKGVRLLRLSPGSHIKEHRDHDLAFEQGEVRLHFPVLTHPDVVFVVDGERVPMKAGECWYINANLTHSVSNPGPVERIHLVVDGPVTKSLQDLFLRAEKKYSTVTTPIGENEAIIRELRLMNTPVSLRLAEEMEAARAKKPDHWYPTALDDAQYCQWTDLQDLPFTDPFFHETLNRAAAFNQRPFKVLSDLSFLSEWTVPHVLPSAFIFHVSRCGSTLITQLLGLDPRNITLAEVPFLDQLLRAGHSISGALRLYGQRRSGNEKKLFVKADSWHVCFYRQLREWFPEVPFFLLYRSPEEVLHSHRKRRGMQSVPGIVDLWDGNPPVSDNLDDYMTKVLSVYFQCFLDIATLDKNAHLVNYAEGIPRIVEKIAFLTNTPLTPDLRARMEERSGYHAKFPDQKFSEIPGAGFPSEMMAPLHELYARLEALRLP